MLYDIKHDDFDQVIRRNETLRTIGSGYEFTEGPAWHPGEQHLTFSDIVGNTMYRWHWGSDAPEVFRKPSNMGNGSTYDAEGRLLTCEHATSRVVRMGEDGEIEVMASHYGDKELNSPNDIVVSRAGAIWFTDPLPGRKPFFGVPREQELDFQGVWRIAPEGGDAAPVLTDFTLPNGICFNPDESTLYVNDTPNGHIRRFDHDPDGNLSGGEIFAEVQGDGEGVPDGLKTDVDGRVWCTGPGGIHVFASDGTPLGAIRLPEKTANFAWGGPDRKTLFTTSSTSVYALDVAVTGHVLF